MKNPLKIYKRRKNSYNNLLKEQNKTINKLSSMRLIVVLIGILNILFLYITKTYSFIYYILLGYIILFTYIVVIHNKVKHNYKYACKIHKINEEAIERFNGNWNKFKDNGLEFQDDSHNFSNDLDIFGQGSLFQYINTTTTYMGRLQLKNYLTRLCKNKEDIMKRQESIDELSTKLPWRQRFMSEGLMIVDKPNNNEDLYGFVESKDELYTRAWVIIGSILIPVISIGTIILHFLKIIPYQIPILAIAIQFFIFTFKYKERSKVLNIVYKYKQSIKVYSKMLYQIEKNKFPVKISFRTKGKAYRY